MQWILIKILDFSPENLQLAHQFWIQNLELMELCVFIWILKELFCKKKAATVSVYGSYESVIARDVDDEIELAHGPGGGLLIYLKQIAFPAVAFGFAYNMPQNVWQYVVSLGVSF